MDNNDNDNADDGVLLITIMTMKKVMMIAIMIT